jgi:hypothetical protein
MFDLQPPRHISTLPNPEILTTSKCFPVYPELRTSASVTDELPRPDSSGFTHTPPPRHSLLTRADEVIERGLEWVQLLQGFDAHVSSAVFRKPTHPGGAWLHH